MDTKPILKKHLCLLDNIVLCPTMTMGFSCMNKKTGTVSGKKSISFKTSATLWEAIIFIASLFFALYTIRCMMQIKMKRKIVRKMKKGRGLFWKK